MVMVRNDKIRGLLTGQAGVHRVASELQLRGFNVLFPSVDHGYDLMVEGGVRIQVKSAHLAYRRTVYPQGAYWFKFQKSAVISQFGKIRERPSQKFSEICEFVVLWGIEQSRFWVVPASLLDDKQGIIVGPDVWYRTLDVSKIREMSAAGMTQSEIAKELGVQQMTISRRLRGLFKDPKNACSTKVRECDGRWDLVESYLASVTEADLAASGEISSLEETFVKE